MKVVVVIAVVKVGAVVAVAAWTVEGTAPHSLYSLCRVCRPHTASRCRHHRRCRQRDIGSYWCMGKAGVVHWAARVRRAAEAGGAVEEMATPVTAVAKAGLAAGLVRVEEGAARTVQGNAFRSPCSLCRVCSPHTAIQARRHHRTRQPGRCSYRYTDRGCSELCILARART